MTLTYKEWTEKFAENIKGEAISAQIEYWHMMMEKDKTLKIEKFDEDAFQEFDDFLTKTKIPKTRTYKWYLAKAWKNYKAEEKKGNNNKEKENLLC